MSTIRVIGGGIAGLATAIKIRLQDEAAQVIVHEKKCPESNTQIAGMRVRQHKPGQGTNPSQELSELLKSRNNGILTDEMSQFAHLIGQEINFWETAHINPSLLRRGMDIAKLPSHFDPSWFGPQWGEGKGKGYTVLCWFRELARQMGVQFEIGEVVHLDRIDDHIEAIQIKTPAQDIYHAHADMFVLAGGSIAGTLFHSTNKEIRMSPQRLAFDAGIPLTGATINMWHPFGRTNTDCRAKVGCFETDTIDDVVVQFLNGKIDQVTTAYLRDHKAHDNFPEICRRFIEHGYAVQLIHADGRKESARLSHHYAHLGIQTVDGVSALGMNNVFAAGDAADWYLTGYKQRFPGFGLAKALVDAELIRMKYTPISRSQSEEGSVYTQESTSPIFQGDIQNASQNLRLKDINTEHALELEYGDHTPQENELLISSWESSLGELPMPNSTVALSSELKTAYEHRYVHGMSEPISITNPLISTESFSMGMRR